MVGFDISKKNNGKTSGGIGLPGLSLGKAKEAIGQGLGQASGALKNTGEKVEDFLFGRPKNQSNENSLSLKNNGKISRGIGLPGLSLGKAEEAIGQGLGQASGALKNTGDKVEDFLFGRPKNQSNENSSLSIKNNGKLSGGIGLPSLSLGKAEEAIGQGLGRASGALKNTGEKVEDFVLGRPKNQSNENSSLSISAPGLGSIFLNTGKLSGGSSILTSTFNEIDHGLNKTGTGLEKAGETNLDGLFGKNKNTTQVHSTKLLGTTLPGLSFGGTSLPNLSDVEKKINKDIEKVNSGTEKTVKNVADFIFGGGNKTQAMPGISFTEKDDNSTVEGNVGFEGKISNTTLPSLSLGGLNMLSGKDTTKNVDKSSKKIDSGIEKTSEKLSDFLLGVKTPEAPLISGGFTNSPTTFDVTKKNQENMGKINVGVGKAGVKTEDYLSGVESETTIEPAHDSDRKFGSGVTLRATTISKKVQHDLGILEGNVEKTGEKVIDSFFGNGNGKTAYGNQSPSTLPSDISNVGSSSILETTTEDISNSFSGPDAKFTTTGEQPGFSVITNHPMTSLEESANGIFGISEMPTNHSTKSEETLRKIEDILQGSGQITSVPPIGTDQNLQKVEKNGENLNRISSNSGFIYTNEVSNVDSTTLKQRTQLNTSILEVSEKSTTPIEQNPFFLVSNSTTSTGEQNTPLLPPSVFDKPTGGKARFIPIFPPTMESTVRNIATPSTTISSHTLTPSLTAAPHRSLTPVEYGAIGIGTVFIFALLAYIYQKYKQYRTSSSGGSYSPKTHHRDTSGRKRSTKSNDSEGGQSLDVNEANETTIIQSNENGINSEIIVVEIAPELQKTEEVVEMPVTKTVFNGLQKSSMNDNLVPSLTSEKSEDSIETISEKQKSCIEKPPRRSKTPINSPEKFTSDKTSASQLNGDSLKTVSHAIGGILRSQVPDIEVTEKQTSSQQPHPKEPNSVCIGESVSALTDSLQPKSLSENILQGDEAFEKANITKNISEETNHSGPLYASLDTEVDAGSEYFSADENSDSKNSPPHSPSPKYQFEELRLKILRAEDVYNTEIVTEDGRRRSIEEDIADSIESITENDLLDTTLDAPTENINGENEVCPSEAVDSENVSININNSEHYNIKTEINQNELPREIHVQNLINAEKTNSHSYRKEEAEAIIDDILRVSNLDLQTVHSIRQDLGNSTEMKQRVTWYDEIPCSDTIKDDSGKTENHTEDDDKSPIVDSEYFQNNAVNNVDELKESVFLIQSELQNLNNLIIERNTEYLELQNKQTQHVLTADFDHENIVSSDHVEENTTTFERNSEIPKSENGLFANAITISVSNNSSDINTLKDQTNYSIDEGCPVEHKIEFIPPNQPQTYEGELIVFSDSEREYNAESNCQSQKQPSINQEEDTSLTNSSYIICEECGGIQDEELVEDELIRSESTNLKENVQQNRAKWYVPNDDSTDLPLSEKTAGGLYIVLSEKASEPTPCTDFVTSEILDSSETINRASSGRSHKEKKVSNKISYAYLDVTDDPRNEGWPGHLPKNIHSISGVGLTKITDVSPSSYGVLKEEESEIIPSSFDNRKDNIEEYERCSSKEITQKPIPKFIIPNMDARLSKKRSSRRRQIKSLDSGVHHYYGEYLNLVECPEIETQDVDDNTEKVIEDVITIKPDGSITEEKIIIQNSK